MRAITHLRLEYLPRSGHADQKKRRIFRKDTNWWSIIEEPCFSWRRRDFPYPERPCTDEGIRIDDTVIEHLLSWVTLGPRVWVVSDSYSGDLDYSFSSHVLISILLHHSYVKGSFSFWSWNVNSKRKTTILYCQQLENNASAPRGRWKRNYFSLWQGLRENTLFRWQFYLKSIQ